MLVLFTDTKPKPRRGSATAIKIKGDWQTTANLLLTLEFQILEFRGKESSLRNYAYTGGLK